MTSSWRVWVLVLLLTPVVVQASAAQQNNVRMLIPGNPMSYVSPFVANGSVKYSSLDKAKLKKMVNVFALRCSTLPVDTESLGYLVDLYNAACIYNVLRHDVPAKPTDVKDFFTEKFIPWGTDRISLNSLENEIIRPKYNEPLVHFVLVCAARGCPRLVGRPFGGQSGAEILRTMSQSARQYFSSVSGLSVDGGKVRISKILDWYREDFGGTNASILVFVRKYAPKDMREVLEKATSDDVAWIEYDWTLNNQ